VNYSPLQHFRALLHAYGNYRWLRDYKRALGRTDALPHRPGPSLPVTASYLAARLSARLRHKQLADAEANEGQPSLPWEDSEKAPAATTNPGAKSAS